MIRRYRKGLVSACASTIPKAITGCQIKLLGFFDYVLVASPSFVKQHFTNKKAMVKSLIQAPSVIFDSKDYLHARYLKSLVRVGSIIC